MVSKRFKNKLCAYCSIQPSVTGDHIFARKFFTEEHRDNLPQAPTCDSCNNRKSELEHYLTTLFPFGGRHKHAGKNLTDQVPKRLEKNRRLHSEMRDGKVDVSLVQGEETDSTFALPIREGAIEALFKYIVKGLAWHHWKVYLDNEFSIEVLVLSDIGKDFFQREFFSKNSAQRVLEKLGDETIIYEGMQGIDCPQVSVWRFHMYGGMIMADGKQVSSTEIGAMSGPLRVMQK